MVLRSLISFTSAICLLGHMFIYPNWNSFLACIDAISLATFCMSTLLSPSAVIPEWANAIPSPNLFTDRYPCPPHLSTHWAAMSLQFQEMNGLMKQHYEIMSWLGSLIANFT